MQIRFLFIALLFYSTLHGQENETIHQKGKASFYADKFNGRKTANGEIFNNADFTAAHNSLPFNSLVRVTNPKNNRTVVVRINDRGPFIKGRIIDLTKAAAVRIGLDGQGATAVDLILTNLTLLTTEINNAFLSNYYSDCLGNADSLTGVTAELWQTKNLQHMLYIANDFDETNKNGKVIIMQKKSNYVLLLTGFNNQSQAKDAIFHLKQEGFFSAKIFYSRK